jgi:predicted GNAT family acetyltransferase
MATFHEITDPEAFLDRAAGLVTDQARNNLIIGIARTIARSPDVYPSRRMFIAERFDGPIAASLVTAPYNMILADARDDEAASLLAEHIFDADVDIPGVTGNRPTVDAFVATWQARSRTSAELSMRQGVFAIDTVADLDPAPGAPRRATIEDLDLIVAWQLEFAREALPDEEHDHDRMIEMTERRLGGDGPGGYWVWVDAAEVVCLSGHGGSTGSGIRIGPVYTPRKFRGRGYATNLVAHQSRILLGSGYRFCFLYTDLANPTANEIYKRIGYREVAESAMYRFG